MMNKRHISAQELLENSFQLANIMYQSGFRPDLMIGVWRGGSPIAIAIHEYFRYMGHEMDHMPVRAISYTGINERNEQVEVEGLEYLKVKKQNHSSVLLVDDVFDTGNSFQAIRKLILSIHPDIDLKLATPWYKPENNQTSLVPDFYLHTTDQWLVFPHELEGLSISEITQYKPAISDLFRKA